MRVAVEELVFTQSAEDSKLLGVQNIIDYTCPPNYNSSEAHTKILLSSFAQPQTIGPTLQVTKCYLS